MVLNIIDTEKQYYHVRTWDLPPTPKKLHEAFWYI